METSGQLVRKLSGPWLVSGKVCSHRKSLHQWFLKT